MTGVRFPSPARCRTGPIERRLFLCCAVVRRRPDRLFLLTGGVQGLAWSAGLPAVVWWVVELRLSPLQLALLGTALVGTILLTEAPTGVLADLCGRKPSVVASFAVMGTAIGLMAASPAFGALIVWQAVWAVGWTMQSGAATAWVTDELPAGSGRPPVGDEAGCASTDAGGESPPAEARHDGPRAALLDQLIVRHATWRAVGVMAGVAVMVGAGWWSLRGALVIAGTLTLGFAAYLAGAMAETSFRRNTPERRIAGGAWREARAIWRHGAALTLRRRMLLGVVSAAVITGFAGEAIERLDTLRLVTLGLPTTTAAKPWCSSAWSGSSWPRCRFP